MDIDRKRFLLKIANRKVIFTEIVALGTINGKACLSIEYIRDVASALLAYVRSRSRSFPSQDPPSPLATLPAATTTTDSLEQRAPHRPADAASPQLFVRAPSGTLVLDASAATAGGIKLLLQARTGIPAEQQRLIFAGKQLEDGATLAECGLRDGSALCLALRLRGGMQTDAATATPLPGLLPQAPPRARRRRAKSSARGLDELHRDANMRPVAVGHKRHADQDAQLATQLPTP
jgi:hypothetical protein